MRTKIKTALMGIAGYGHHHVHNILEGYEEGSIELVGAIARRPERCPSLDELTALGIDIYPTMEDFYRHQAAEFMVISTPIHLHRRHVTTALEHGSHVFCEKPVTATIQDALALVEARDRADRFVAIGYQWSFSNAVQALKTDIMSGVLGRPVQLKSFVSWPRHASYYRDRGWGGVLKTADGDWLLDSPVSNATAHYLHNGLYVVGASRETSGRPVSVQAELYRANAIENYDTAALRIHTADGIELMHFTSHAVPSRINPMMTYRFEHATVTYEGDLGDTFTATFDDGRTKSYGSPSASRAGLLESVIEDIRNGIPPACGIEAATPLTLCANGAQESTEVVPFPDEMIVRDEAEDALTWGRETQAALVQGYALGRLPAELGNVSWARAGKVVSLSDYTSYPSAVP